MPPANSRLHSAEPARPVGGLLGFSGLGLLSPGGVTKQGGRTTIHTAACALSVVLYLS